MIVARRAALMLTRLGVYPEVGVSIVRLLRPSHITAPAIHGPKDVHAVFVDAGPSPGGSPHA